MTAKTMTPITDMIADLLAEGVPWEAVVAAARVLERSLNGNPARVPHRNRREIKGPFYVYGLVDPRDGETFYIGMTKQPLGRLSGHKSDPASAAYHRIRDIRKCGEQVRMEIIEQFGDRERATRFERSLIVSRPGLLNRETRQQ